jgi:uncharacterized repeat protein (TIGR01451 family)
MGAGSNTNNGQVDAGEQSAGAGIVVVLRSATGAVYTTTTDANGYYRFDNLDAGSYVVSIPASNFGVGGPLAGYVSSDGQRTTFTAGDNAYDHGSDSGDPRVNGSTSAKVIIGVSEPLGEKDLGAIGAGDNGPGGDANDNLTADFGFWRPSTIGDYVWEDLNSNGQQDPNEPPIAGVLVTLTRPDGTVIQTTTSVTGFYQFTGLTPNVVYTVTFNTPNGYAPTLANVGDDATDSDGTVVTVVLQPGQQNNTVDSGFIRPGSIGDYVWEDVNHNGQQDANEPPLVGVLVSLQTPTGTITTQTNAFGFYQFTNLLANTPYTVTFSIPSGYQPTLANVGGDSADSDGTVVTNIVLQPGQQNTTVDSGFWRPASVGDRVWLDLNNNGLQDDGEPGVANVTVKLYSNGMVVSTTQTNANGNYLFTNLTSGTYTVSFMLPGGYVFTTQNVGSDEGIDSDANENTGETGPITLVSGAAEARIDAGLTILAQLSIEKRVTTPTGGGSGTAIEAGDELVYTLIAKNSGGTVATNVVITDILNTSLTQYVAGSAVPAVTRIVGNKLVWEIGNMNPGQQVVLVFRVRVFKYLGNATIITNVAQIGGKESGTSVIVRLSNVVDNPLTPGTVTLVNFAATPTSGRGVQIKWTTNSEVSTWGFTLYRAEGLISGNQIPNDAVKVNPEAIMGEGRGGGGATYQFMDTTAVGGKTYTYWLVETETSGRTTVYGPSRWAGSGNMNAGNGVKLYLPLLIRSTKR